MNYLIFSNSYRLIQEEIDVIINKNININKYDLRFDDIEDILEEAAYFSLFDEKKYIIISNSDCFGSSKTKIDEEIIIEYLKNPNPNTTIIFTTNNKIDERKKITTVFKEKNKIINIKNLTIKEIFNRINDFFKKDKYTIDSKSIYYIINSSLNNYDLTYNNALKIKLYFLDNHQIDYETVVKLTSVNIEENNFKFIDYVICKDYQNAFTILQELILNKTDCFALINLLFREYKMIAQVKEYVKQTTSKIEILKELKLQDWQLDKYIKNSYNYSEKDLEKVIQELTKMDFKIKSGQIDKQLALEMFILNQ